MATKRKAKAKKAEPTKATEPERVDVREILRKQAAAGSHEARFMLFAQSPEGRAKREAALKQYERQGGEVRDRTRRREEAAAWREHAPPGAA